MRFTAAIGMALMATTTNSFCLLFPPGSCNTPKQIEPLPGIKTQPDIKTRFLEAMKISSEHNWNLYFVGGELLKEQAAALHKEMSKNAYLEMKIDGLESDNASLRRENEVTIIIIANHEAEKRANDMKTKELTRQNANFTRQLATVSTSLGQCQGEYRDAQDTIRIQNEQVKMCTVELSGCNTEKAELKNDIGEAAQLHQTIGQLKQGLTEVFRKHIP